MTVKDLIEVLQGLPPNLDVEVSYDCGFGRTGTRQVRLVKFDPTSIWGAIIDATPDEAQFILIEGEG